MSRRPAQPSDRSGAATLFLGLGYLCLLALFCNIVVRAGWVHARLPGLNGFFSTLWRWALGAAVCFVLAWYIERPRRRQR